MKIWLRCLAVLAPLATLVACTDVKAPPPPDAPRIVSLVADKTQIGPGELATITVKTENASEVQLLDDRGQTILLSGTVAEGTAQVAPTRTTFYVARVQGAGGRDVAFVQIAVGEPLRDLFLLAVPAELESGETGQLIWGAPGATRVTLQTGDAAPVALTGTTGTVTVAPARSERYTLSATLGSGAPITAFAEVRVKPQLLELHLDTPNGLNADAGVSIRWTTRGAQQLVVREQRFGQLAEITTPAELDQGSAAWTVPSTLPTGLPVADGVPLRFLVTVSSSAGEVSRELSAVVGDAPVIERVTAPSAASAGLNFLLTWNTLGATKIGVEVGGELVFETQPGEQARVASGGVLLPAPTTITTYTVVATNDRGVSARQSVMVRPSLLPQITAFTLTPSAISAPGESVTASWTAVNARRLQLRIENGPTILIDGTQVNAGSATFVAGSAQSVTLEAYNEAEDRDSETRQLRLTGAPVVTVNPSPVLRNSNATLSWNLAALGVTEVVGLPTARPGAVTSSSRFVDLEADPAAVEVLFADRTGGSAEVRLPQGFRFPFLGSPRSSLWVAVDGYIAFSAPPSLGANQDLGDTANSAPSMLAPYWDDLTLGSTAKVLSAFGPRAPTGERTFIIQWTGAELAGVTGTQLTFQVQLTESGEVAFIYRTLTGENGGENASVGVKESGSGIAQSFSFNGATRLAEGMELVFFAGGPATGTLQFVAGKSQTISFLGRLGSSLIPFSVNLTSIGVGDVLVSEAMPFPEVSVVTSGQWIELHNTVDTAIDLGNLRLVSNGSTDGGYLIPPGTVLPPNGYAVFGQTLNSTDNGGAGVDYVVDDLPLSDLSDTVTLELNGEPISSLSWTTSTQAHSTQPRETVLYAPDAGSTCMLGTRTFGPNGAIGTPGDPNETCSFYRVDRIPGGFIDIAATGTELLASASDYYGVGAVTLPRPFSYFGQTFTEANLTMTGFFTFGSTVPVLTSYSSYVEFNDTLPGSSLPNGTVAPWWDDLVRNTNGKILMRRDEDRTILSFQDFRIYATGSSINFQVHLIDSGALEFHYGSITSTASYAARHRGSTATVWLETPSGGSAVSAGVNVDGTISANSGYRFTP